jgi:hypothetical protein
MLKVMHIKFFTICKATSTFVDWQGRMLCDYLNIQIIVSFSFNFFKELKNHWF